MKKIQKQILVLVLLVAVFAFFDLGIYLVFTKRCISDYSEGMQAKSIELDQYLPFEEDSQVVKIDSDMKLSGDLPVVDGAAALYPVCSGMVYSLYPEESVMFDGQEFLKESALQMNNTRGAYKGVVDGDVDFIICAKPSKEQLEYAEEQGVTLKMVPIGKEAFVFIVNAKNPVSDLSVEQVRGIYNGTYTNWKQLGGEREWIAALQRNEGSGSQTAMLSFMNGEKMVVDYDSFLGSAIGYSFRFYVEGIVEDGGVKMLSLNGVYPNEENIRNDSYPIVGNIYAVYREDNENPNIPVLIDWLLSPDGQRMIEETGYVGINAKEEAAELVTTEGMEERTHDVEKKDSEETKSESDTSGSETADEGETISDSEWFENLSYVSGELNFAVRGEDFKKASLETKIEVLTPILERLLAEGRIESYQFCLNSRIPHVYVEYKGGGGGGVLLEEFPENEN